MQCVGNPQTFRLPEGGERRRFLNTVRPNFYGLFLRGVFQSLNQTKVNNFNGISRHTFRASVYGEFTIEFDRSKMITGVWMSRVGDGPIHREVCQLCWGEMDEFLNRYVATYPPINGVKPDAGVLRSHGWCELLSAIQEKRWNDIAPQKSKF